MTDERRVLPEVAPDVRLVPDPEGSILAEPIPMKTTGLEIQPQPVKTAGAGNPFAAPVETPGKDERLAEAAEKEVPRG